MQLRIVPEAAVDLGEIGRSENLTSQFLVLLVEVADLLKELDDSYQYPVVRLNNERISRPFFEQTLVPDNSDIFLISLVAGG